ncbi:MAG: gliding motility protein, partial [Chryseobacterium sp.]
MKQLSEKYEYIIVDAPPVGLVADYYILSKYSHANLFMVRENYSKLNSLEDLNSIHQDKKLNNLFIVYNDSKGRNGYGYGYGYGYG